MSMDEGGRKAMTESFGDTPVCIDAAGVSLARRPRLYWCDWELLPGRGVVLQPPVGSGSAQYRTIELKAEVNTRQFLLAGCQRTSQEPLPTFTTSRPRGNPGRKPAGLATLDEEERKSWEPPTSIRRRTLSRSLVVAYGCPTSSRERSSWFSKGLHLPVHG